MTPVCDHLFWAVSQFNRPIHYLEIGVQEGGSLNAVLDCDLVQLAVGIDTWGDVAGGTNRGNPNHVLARMPSQQHRYLLITGDSKVILPGLRHPFDVIFVDGDHSEAGCLSDLDSVLPLLKKDGLLIVDDMDHPVHPYLHKATEDWAARNNLLFTHRSVGYGIAEIRFL
jgi:hypothetical protein